MKVTPLLSTYFKLSNQNSSLNIVKFTDLIIKCCNTVANAIKNKELRLIPWKSTGYQLHYFLQERSFNWKYFYMYWVKAGEFKNKLWLLQSLQKFTEYPRCIWVLYRIAIVCLFSYEKMIFQIFLQLMLCLKVYLHDLLPEVAFQPSES